MYVSESDYHYFAQIGTTKRYLAGEYIFTRGELASTVYLIKSGRVLVTTSLGDGRMLTFSVLKKEAYSAMERLRTTIFVRWISAQ